MYDHHSTSFLVHVVNLTKHLIFHSDASFLIQRYELVIHDKNGSCFCRPSCDEGSSLDEEQAFRHLPYPLAGTCLLDNDPNVQMFCTTQHLPLLVYIHVGNLD